MKYYQPFLLLFLSHNALAATLTNDIEGVGPNNQVKPYFCVLKNDAVTHQIAPGESLDIPAGYVGGALRFDGCSVNNSYLGYLDFDLKDNGNNELLSYKAPDGAHIAYQKGSISSYGVITGKINYTAIAANANLTQGKAGKNWDYVGINLSGLEFSNAIDPMVIPNLSEVDQAQVQSDLNETTQFIKQGINTVRVPVRWGYLQLEGPGEGPIYMDYYSNYLEPLLETLTHADIHTIIDLHAYMRYANFGSQHAGCGPDGPCPDGQLVTDSASYQDLWSKLYTLIKNNPNINQDYLLLDLVNEPVDVPDDKVFTVQTDLIKTLRHSGFAGKILIEGNSWTGLHSWTTHHWQGQNGIDYTNATLFSRENFNKAGITDLSNILINVHQYLDQDYSGTHDECQQDLSTTGADGFNLLAFTDYLKANQLKAIVTEFGTGRNAQSCAPALTQFMNYLMDNSSKSKDYGFVGWTIWSTGHGWGDYNLRVKPDSYQMDVLKKTL